MGLLFSSTNVEANTYGPKELIHNHHRAPTDESIKLAKEYEDKIHANIAEKLFVKNNLIDYTFVFNRDGMFMDPRIYLKIKINGNEFSEVFSLVKLEDFSIEAIEKRLTQWLCQKMLQQPLQDCLIMCMNGGNMNFKTINGYPQIEKE